MMPIQCTLGKSTLKRKMLTVSLIFKGILYFIILFYFYKKRYLPN